MLIGEVSKQFGISIETLRYYDRIGILTPERLHQNRYYADKNIAKLKAIMMMKRMMFSLDEIKNILNMDEKIDKGLKNNFMDSEAAGLLLLQLKDKYKYILDMEKDIGAVKKKLEVIINKTESALKEGKNE